MRGTASHARTTARPDDGVAQRLVIALPVVVLEIRSHRPPQRVFPKEDQSVQALRFQRTEKTLELGIQIGASRRENHWFDVHVLER